jgi:hypothetical protein
MITADGVRISRSLLNNLTKEAAAYPSFRPTFVHNPRWASRPASRASRWPAGRLCRAHACTTSPTNTRRRSRAADRLLVARRAITGGCDRPQISDREHLGSGGSGPANYRKRSRPWEDACPRHPAAPPRPGHIKVVWMPGRPCHQRDRRFGWREVGVKTALSHRTLALLAHAWLTFLPVAPSLLTLGIGHCAPTLGRPSDHIRPHFRY